VRQGYRPSDVAIGVARPVLAYPRLVDLANALLSLVASDADPYATGFDPTQPPNLDRVPKPGKAHDQLQQLLRVMHQELRTSTADPPLAPLASTPDANDPTRALYTRPLGSLELTRSIFFAPYTSNPLDASAHPVVKRDGRGVALIALDASGKIPAPFVDADGDGLADLDDLDRYVTSDGSRAPSPFFSLDGADGPRNAYGLAVNGGAPMYQAFDTRQTILAKVASDLVPLFDSQPKREAIMNLVAGMPVVFGAHDVNAASSKTYPPDPSLVDDWKLAHATPPPAGLALMGCTPAPVS